MLLLGYFNNDYDSDEFWDKADEIPGGFIIHREIKKAIRGENFFYNDETTGDPIRCEGFDIEAFNFYFQIWDDFHFLHLTPNGKGTNAERRWVLDIIKTFEKTHISINNFLQDKAMKKVKRG